MARKFHYFESDEGGTQALCGKWMIWKSHRLSPEVEGSPSKLDCVACRRKLDKQKEASVVK